MNRFALLTFYRSLVRHKLYAALNIGGLAVGIAVFLVLGLYVRFETSFEHWMPGYQHIYLVESRTPDEISATFRQNTPVAFWTAVEHDLPGTIGTRLSDANATVIKDGVGVNEDLALVDPGFPQVFDLPVVQGDLHHAFDDPSSIVLTQTTARKYFGDADAVGKPLTVAYEGKSHIYHVVAVLRAFPKNTEFDADMLARMTISEDKASRDYKSNHQWNYGNPKTYVRLPDAAAARRFADQMPGLSARHAQNETPDNPGYKIDLKVQPLADVHGETAGEKIAITTLGIVGVLTLLIAIVNYVNLATARAGLRAREVAMRKVLGADRGTLARHYVGEAVATAAIAAFIGLAIAELGLPLVNAASGLSLSMDYVGANGVLLPLIVLVLVVGLVAGIYPATVLARMPAAAVLASARSPGGGRAGTYVREALVVFQFAIAIAFLIGTMVLVSQTRHVRNADVGYDRQGLMLVTSLGSSGLNDAQRDGILHRLSSVPGVTAATVANNVPGPEPFTSETSVPLPGVPGNGPSLRQFDTTPGFFDVMGAKLVAGRLFDSRPADINPNALPVNANSPINFPYNIVVNRTALAALHIPSPQAAIGRTFAGPNTSTRTIIGVIDDMRFDDPRTPIPPTMYGSVPRDPQSAIAILRFSGDPKVMHDAAQTAWRQEAPEVPFQAKTAVQNLQHFYEHDDHTAKLFTIGAVLAVAIGCVGLWGLASFNTARRIKEIGIRKTLGASSADVVKLLVGQFLRPVLIANLFAWPLAFFAMRTWLAGFDDRIALSPLFFVAATVLAVAIAVLTVLAQSLRAARSTPAWALRHE
jgi:putative ABC transport system permease protein